MNGSQISVLEYSQFIIFTKTSTSINIRKLLINLNFAPSKGNITLIGNVRGELNITGYQVLGIYQSTSLVTMIGINAIQASINVNDINFQPSIYNVGNCSSYLFSSITSSLLTKFVNITIILGTNSSYQLLSSTINGRYQFGGIVTYINVNSKVAISNVIVQQYQSFSSNYVEQSGIIIGQTLLKSIDVHITNVCLQAQTQSVDQNYYVSNFGLVGSSVGNISLQFIIIFFSFNGQSLTNYGVIGSSTSDYSEIYNIKICTNVSQNGGSQRGILIGIYCDGNISIQNISVINSSISSYAIVGGLIGSCNNANATVFNTNITNSNISTTNSYAGGIIGYLSYSNASVQNLFLSQISIIGQYIGGLIGFISSNSVSTNQYVIIISTKIQSISFRAPTDYYNIGIILGNAQSTIVKFYFFDSSANNNTKNDIYMSECSNLYYIYQLGQPIIGC
ncbi:Hypothetical_protein [Hexamita inflata]|nr:Hypothetical protein HINF_LOCUS65409 [Hexamita inflata]